MHRCVVTWAALLGLALSASGQSEPVSFLEIPWPLDTGWVSNDSTQMKVVTAFDVHVDGAASLRLHFALEIIGPGLLRTTSLLDGAVQTLTADQSAQWQDSTCYFNGDSVHVELLEPPGAGQWRLVLGSVEMGIVPIEPKTQCGLVDDRQLSADARVGRMLPLGCTAWILNDCAHCLLSAGHCTGPVDVIEFNVPFSTILGTLVHPGPEDQYAVDLASQQSNGGLGVGNDWAYFGVFPNPVTGLSPGEKQAAWFSLEAPPAAAGQTLRVTGYGSDDSPDLTFNQVQQTATGPFTAGWATTLQYQVDTTAGGSGSPIVLESSGAAIGIHTHGGCTLLGGANQGTASTHPDLQAALANPQGVCRGTCGWTDLGGALAGSNGLPALAASGLPLPGSQLLLTVTGLPLLGATNMVVGFTVIHMPFKGGVLMPAPDFLVAGLPIVLGVCAFDFGFPAGMPAGTVVVFQFWTPDPGAPMGLSASNGVELSVP
jgi:hypothetical protein